MWPCGRRTARAPGGTAGRADRPVRRGCRRIGSSGVPLPARRGPVLWSFGGTTLSGVRCRRPAPGRHGSAAESPARWATLSPHCDPTKAGQRERKGRRLGLEEMLRCDDVFSRSAGPTVSSPRSWLCTTR